jgi:hypothetical protein
MDTQRIWQPEHLGRVLSWRWCRPEFTIGQAESAECECIKFNDQVIVWRCGFERLW